MAKYGLAALLAFSTLCHGEYGVYGHGNETCADWLKDSQENPPWGRIIKQSWVLGYVTAFNNVQEVSGKPLRESDGATIARWVDDHCRTNPQSTMEEAALAVVERLRQ